MTASTGIALAAIVNAAALVGALELRSRDNVVAIGFWFEDVTFGLHDPALWAARSRWLNSSG